LVLDADGAEGGASEGGIRSFTKYDSLIDLPVLSASSAELEGHEYCMDLVDKKSDGAIWRKE